MHITYDRCTRFIQGTRCIDECTTDVTLTILQPIALPTRMCESKCWLAMILLVGESIASTDEPSGGTGGLPQWAIIVFAVVGVVLLTAAIGTVIVCLVIFLNRSR